MFGKFFASAFTGSMAGAGVEVFAVWGYVIANAVDSQVELNPKVVAGLLGTTPEKVIESIDYLCRPDPNSRSQAKEGRRLIKEGAFAYQVVNHGAYKAIRDENDRREYNRIKKAEGRARGVNTRVKRSIRKSTVSAQAEAEAEAEAEATIKPSRRKKPAEGNGNRLDAIFAVWEARYGPGSFKAVAGQAAKYLKPLFDAHHDSEQIAENLNRYLTRTEARYVSLSRFASTYAQHGPSNLSGRADGLIDNWFAHKEAENNG